MDGDNLPATIEAADMEIELIKPDGSAAYWRDTRRQGRYRDLLAHRETLQGARAPEAEEDNPLAIPSPAKWTAANPGIPYSVCLDISRNMTDVVFAVPDHERADFIASFEALPGTVATAMGVELQDRSYAGTAPLSEEDFQGFVANGGEIIAREWGYDARGRLAKADARLNRIAGYLESEAQIDALTNWLVSLSPHAVAAVFRKLGA